ncbi:MAG TPA: zinc ribbon domain-containing protein [bacterium]|jgi:hypothetical protein|nr:zinc ribbon domain-containing protein [bacterium]
MINCSKCGEENPESAEFCEYCGAILAKSLNSNVDINLPITGNEVKSNDSTPTIVTVLLLIFVFPIGVIVMWFWPKWKVWVKLLITLIAIIPIFFIVLPMFLLAGDSKENIQVYTGPETSVVNTSKDLQKSRDAARLSDMDLLKNAIDIALEEGEISLISTEGCTTCGSDSGTRIVDGKDGWVKFSIPTGKKGLAKYIPLLPVDPLNTGEYVYTFSSTPSEFEINSVLESKDNASKMNLDGGNNKYFYEIGTNLEIR